MEDVDITLSTENSRRLLEEAKHFAPKGIQGDARWYEPFPLVFKKGLGARLWDVDDNAYVDYWCAAGTALLGHNDPRVREAVVSTLENEGVLFTTPHPKEMELARRLCQLIPCAQKTILCGGGGSDAIYNAIRVSRAYTGKTKLLKFEGGYHGWHDDQAVSVRPNPADAGPALAPHSVAISAGSLAETVQQVVVAPFNNEAAVESLIRKEKDHLAAVIIEPVCHSSGCLIVKETFLKFLREICTAYGIVLVFDEIITGFRHHIGGAQAIFGVTPDLGAFGKAMANGFPISALVGRDDIMSMFGPEGPVLASGTYMGHPVGVSAALKTIDILTETDIYPKLWRQGDKVRTEINLIIDELDLNARCYSFGSAWCLYFTRKVDDFRDIIHLRSDADGRRKDDGLRRTLLNNGILISQTNSNKGYISAAHTDEDIDKTIEVVAHFLTKNQADLR